MPLYVLIPFSLPAPLSTKCLSGSLPLRRLLRPWPPALLTFFGPRYFVIRSVSGGFIGFLLDFFCRSIGF